MICRDSNLCGKRKASEAAEESNDENDMATAAKIMKPAENDGDEEANSIGFDKSIESEFKTLKSLIQGETGFAPCQQTLRGFQRGFAAHDLRPHSDHR